MEERVEPCHRDSSAYTSVGEIIEPESRNHSTGRVGTEPNNGSVDVIVELGSGRVLCPS